MKKAHKLLNRMDYDLKKVEKGYTNRTLYVNLSDNTIKSKPVTDMMKEKFIGGRGFGLWYLWNAVSSETKWNDPENEIIISTGPIGGTTQYPGAGKSLVVSLSPLTGSVMDSNVGGYFGPLLKFAGWDAIEIQGKAQNDVIVYIDGNNGYVTIEEAPEEDIDSHLVAEQFTEMYAESEEDKRNIAVVSAGRGSDNSLIGVLNFSFYDVKRQVPRLKQAGRGGIGTVFRDKKIKALVVKFTGVKGDTNGPVDKSKIIQAGLKVHKEVYELDSQQCRMREVGTAHLTELMNDYDLLPTMNYQYGSHPDADKIHSDIFKKKYFTQGMADGCWYGCSLACAKAVDHFELKTGPYKGDKVCVDAAEYETIAGLGSNCGIFDPEHIIEGNFYCDTYGIDTISCGTLIAFIMECYERGIIDKKVTGGLELKFGNAEDAMELIHQIGEGRGFGKIAGLGIKRMKKIFEEEYGADPKILQDIGMECKGLEYSEYVTKESLAQQGGYALANKGAQHDEAWLIFMDMVNKQIPTFEDKAEALFFFPLFRTWFGLNGLCKLPWNDIEPADNAKTEEPAKVPEHLQNYLDIFYGVTGKKITEEDMIFQSEISYNFQRIFNLKMGIGTREYDMPPYRSVGPVFEEEYESRAERYDKQLKELGYDIEGKSTKEKNMLLRKHREDQYEKLVDAVYKRRGWNSNGVPTLETVKRLGIDFPDVVELISKYQ
ncbi:MAG TPA: aldehyde:ferredoxin oxidoreductase [Thermoanaerobacterales bacterium]|nr:aldehyde:ferredoxin oxidoreductase [Thermoanaerobacterales bacterium]